MPAARVDGTMGTTLAPDAKLADIALPDSTPPASDMAPRPDAHGADLLGAPDPCVSLPALPGKPVLDGVLEPTLTTWAIPPSAWYPLLSPTAPPDEHAVFAAAWRPEGLYVYIRVTDPKVIATRTASFWCEDAIEIFFDNDGRFTSDIRYDDPGTRQFIVPAPRGTAVESRGEIYRDATRVGPAPPGLFASVPVSGGYAVEALVPLGALGLTNAAPLAAGNRIGFDLQVDVARMAVTGSDFMCQATFPGLYMLRRGGRGCGRPSCDVGAFCTPRLEP